MHSDIFFVCGQDAERKKHLQVQRLKKPDRETVAKRVDSIERGRLMELRRKMLGDEERLMMLSAFKVEQKRHLDELHKQAKLQDDAVSFFCSLVLFYGWQAVVGLPTVPRESQMRGLEAGVGLE